MKYLILFLLVFSAYSQETIMSPKSWTHADGNENNFDIWAISVNHDYLWRIDLKTGNIYVIGELGIDIDNAGLSFNQKGDLYMLYSQKGDLNLATINTSTGLATKVASFGKKKDPTIGFEISQNGKEMYWSNCKSLNVIHPDTGQTEKIMDLNDGSWCLAKANGGKLYAIGLRSRDLLIIDPKNKTVKTEMDLSKSDYVPALAITPGGRLYGGRFNATVFGIDGNYIDIGKMAETCHGFAIANDSKATTR